MPLPLPDAHRIGIRVPDRALAADHLAAVVGAGAVRPDIRSRAASAGTATLVHADPVTGIELLDADGTGETAAPRVVDIGTHHLCWRVTDIEAAAAYVADLPGTTVLGDIIEIPEGPIAGNRWVYYRTAWGTLFELQQWPDTPPYTRLTDVRLDHTRHRIDGAALPGYAGVDHTGYSVRDLDSALRYLVDRHGARIALQTDVSAGRDFMRSQFGIDVEGSSRMAMLAVAGLNIELFEHHVGPTRPPRHRTQFGGHHLALRGRTDADIAHRIIDAATESGRS